MQVTPQRTAWAFSPARLMVEIGLIFGLALGALEIFFADMLLGESWSWAAQAALMVLLALPAVFWRLMAAARRRRVTPEAALSSEEEARVREILKQ